MMKQRKGPNCELKQEHKKITNRKSQNQLRCQNSGQSFKLANPQAPSPIKLKNKQSYDASAFYFYGNTGG